jgi:hypothetical protein
MERRHRARRALRKVRPRLRRWLESSLVLSVKENAPVTRSLEVAVEELWSAMRWSSRAGDGGRFNSLFVELDGFRARREARRAR